MRTASLLISAFFLVICFIRWMDNFSDSTSNSLRVRLAVSDPLSEYAQLEPWMLETLPGIGFVTSRQRCEEIKEALRNGEEFVVALQTSLPIESLDAAYQLFCD